MKRTARKRPTIVDVARAAGVSPATVSNAINNRRYVDAQTKVRIDAEAARLGYTPNVHARRMRSRGIGTIGIFSSMPFAISGRASRLGFLMEIAATAAVSALESGFALLLVPPTELDLPPFEELPIDAAIVVEPAADDPHTAQLMKRGIPFVTIGRHAAPATGIASVDIRSGETAQLLLDHLWAMSSKRIALMIGSSRRNSYVETEAAYRQFAQDHRMTPVVLCVDERGGEEAAYAATFEVMASHPRLDGVLVSVDTFAAGALRAFGDLGIAVPDDVRLATRYDGHRARESTPALTAVDLHLEEVADLAVKLLLDRLRLGRTRARSVLAPPPRLIARASTAAPARALRNRS